MKRRKYKYVLLFADWLSLCAAFLMAVGFFHPHRGGQPELADHLFSREFLYFVFYTPVIVFVFQTNQLYRLNIHLTVVDQTLRLLRSTIYASLGLALMILLSGEGWMGGSSRGVVLAFAAFSFPVLVVVRVLVMRSVFRVLVKYRIATRSVLVVGACEHGDRIAKSFASENVFGLALTGFLEDQHPVGEEILPGAKVLGRIDDIEKVVEETKADEILLCLEDLDEEKYLGILDRCAKTKARVMVGAEQFKVITQHVYNESYGGMPVFGVMNSAPYMGAPILKRVGDVVLTSIAVIVLSPVFLVIAAAIAIDSRGPILFKQTRIGKDGKPFTFLKFRSMYVGSDKDAERVKKLEEFIKSDKVDSTTGTKIVDEAKITRVGRFIRRTSLDELPQLFNVLRGEMSLVGPRPCLPYEWESYADWHKRRLSVTPGCTGVWQVFGRSKVGFRDTVIIDLFYMHNMSFRLDVWLVLKTIPVMLFGSGGK